MPRVMLTDKIWNLLSRIMYLTGRIYNKPDHRMTLEGILYRLRTGIPWRYLPKKFGYWNRAFRQFNLWSKKGVMNEVFSFLSRLYDGQWLFIDGSIVKVHQDGTNIRQQHAQAIGKSRGGNSTKIHLAVDSGGLPVYFELSGGQVNDIKHAESLIAASPKAEVVIADKGYTSKYLINNEKERVIKHVIPRRNNNSLDITWREQRND